MSHGTLTKIEGAEAARGLRVMGSKGNWVIDTVISSYNYVVSIASIPSRLFFRENMGERAIMPFALVACAIFYFYVGFWISGILFGLDGMLLYPEDRVHNSSQGQFLLGVLIAPPSWLVYYTISLGVRHIRKVHKEARESDEVGYSYYRGESRYYQNLKGHIVGRGRIVDDKYIRMIHEPLRATIYGFYFVIAGIILTCFQTYSDYAFPLLANSIIIYFTALGVLIWLSAFALYLEEFGIKIRVRGRVLDMTDAEYDVAFINAERERLTLKGKDQSETKKSSKESPKNFIVS